MQKTLADQLQYTHSGMEPDGRGGLQRVVVEKRLWTLQDGGGLVTNCGFIPRIYRVIEKMGHEVASYERCDRKERKLEYDLSQIDSDSLREGQRDMLAAVVSNDGGIVVSPTGSGKSYGMRELCCLYPDARILIAAPGIDATATLARYLAPKLGAIGQLGGGRKSTHRITVSTLESMLKVDYFNEIDILIVDEVHHAPAASYAEAVMAFSAPLKRFGFTATHGNRGDGADLVNEGLFGPVVMEVPYYLAVQRGEVVPIHVIVRECRVGPSYEVTKKIKQIPRKDRQAIWQNHKRNMLIRNDIADVLRNNPDEQVLVICSKVEHQAFLYELLKDLDFVHVSGDLDKKKVHQLQKGRVPVDYTWIINKKKRGWMRKQFEEGKIRRVIATEVWSKAISANECGVVFYTSGSGAINTLLQSAGRTSRVVEDDPDKHGTVVVYRDVFNKTYQGRSDKVIRSLKKEGHKVTVVR